MEPINKRCKSIASRRISNLAIRICRAMQQFPDVMTGDVTNWNRIMDVVAPEGTLTFNQIAALSAAIRSMEYPDPPSVEPANTYIALGYTFNQPAAYRSTELPIAGVEYTGDFYDLCKSLALIDTDARIAKMRKQASVLPTTTDAYDRMAETLFSIHKLINGIPCIE